MAKLQRQIILVDDETGVIDSAPTLIDSQGKRLIIVDADDFSGATVSIQVESNKGNFVTIQDGNFTENGAKLMEGIISGMTIKVISSVSVTGLTVEISS